MVHFGIAFSAESDLVGIPDILHGSLDLRIGAADNQEKVITDSQEYTLILVNHTKEKVTLDPQSFLVRLHVITDTPDLCLHTAMVHWSCPKCKHGGKDRENTHCNKVADTIRTEGLKQVKPLQFLSLHLLQFHRLYHNQQDRYLFQLGIQRL